MIAKEVGVVMMKPVTIAVMGYVTANIAEFEIFTELLGEEFSSTKNTIALIGLIFLIWRAYRMMVKAEREKDQAFEEKKIDIEHKSWKLAHEQKKANEEGLIEVIKDLKQTIKNLKK